MLAGAAFGDVWGTISGRCLAIPWPWCAHLLAWRGKGKGPGEKEVERGKEKKGKWKGSALAQGGVHDYNG